MYREILQYSYRDYFEKFAVPYYWAKGVASPTAESLEKAGDLRTYDAALRANPEATIRLWAETEKIYRADKKFNCGNFRIKNATMYYPYQASYNYTTI